MRKSLRMRGRRVVKWDYVYAAYGIIDREKLDFSELMMCLGEQYGELYKKGMEVKEQRGE